MGVFAGVLFAERRARHLGLSEADIHAAIAWAVIPGFLVAHVWTLFSGHRPSGSSPWSMLQFWNGMSSFGGFAGALAGLLVGFSRRPAPVRLAVAEVLLQALVVGWVFGRLGCAVVHDHIGRLSTFPLAIRFPDGARHDLGLYDMLFTLLVLVPAVVVLNRKPRPPGATIACISLLYAPARFLLDLLRNTDLPGADARHLGLTTAQYACIGLAGIGLTFARRAVKAPSNEPRLSRRNALLKPRG
jgi:phosphatidylglycerol:prolipoprotein diacylglycerol transferase